jgi:hypothetical protein
MTNPGTKKTQIENEQDRRPLIGHRNCTRETLNIHGVVATFVNTNPPG